VKKVVVEVKYSNKCPVEKMGKVMWEKVEVVKEKSFSIYYES
jgi:hypothetical protein